MPPRCAAAAGAAFAAAAALVVACALALVTQGFYKVTTFSPGGFSSATVLGPLMFCTAVVGASRTAGADDFECRWNGGATGPASASSCDRSTGDTVGRHYGALAMVLVGALLVLAAGVAGLCVSRARRKLAYAALGGSVLGVGLLGAGTLLAYDNVFWRYCGAATLCDSVRDGASRGTFIGCEEGRQAPLYVVAGGVASALLTVACGTVQLVLIVAAARADDADDGGGAVADAPPVAGHHRPQRAPRLIHGDAYQDDDDGNDADVADPPREQQRQTRPPTHADAAVAAPTPHPGGDWQWDSGSKLWWSAGSAMYLEHESGFFYHPKSGKWFDPGRNRWLKPHELSTTRAPA